ncbi:hypothetical protein [Bacillus wiedmannii]|nr:hypothetical protein [Bacillus wiedmannii]
MKKKSTLSQVHTSTAANSKQTNSQISSSFLAQQGYTKKKGCGCGKNHS